MFETVVKPHLPSLGAPLQALGGSDQEATDQEATAFFGFSGFESF